MLHVERPKPRIEARSFLPQIFILTTWRGIPNVAAETGGGILTPPTFSDTLVLFLMNVCAVGGQRAVDVISIIFPPTGRIPPLLCQEIQHFEISTLSIAAAFSPGSRKTCPRLAGAHSHKQQLNNCDSSSRFRLHHLCAAVFFHNCQIAITIFIIINFGDPRYHKPHLTTPETHLRTSCLIQFASRSFDTGAIRRRYWPEVSVSCHFPR